MWWLTFQQNPELEFEFYLAQQLGMTVTGLREGMSNDEFVAWGIYFGRQAQEQQAQEQRLNAGGGTGG